ncbi:MAG: hypothetical protein Q8L49_11035 [Burkholderiaceae bacterium]|nr:hypothetical protein [Burkholderiaceae bacterium]
MSPPGRPKPEGTLMSALTIRLPDDKYQMRAERGRGKAARGLELLRKARGE